MKQVFIIGITLLYVGLLSAFSLENIVRNPEMISFYDVPLVCGAAPEIGCGSRLKPLFLDFSKVNQVKEVWSNRQGTVVAIVWNDPILSIKEKNSLIGEINLKCKYTSANSASKHLQCAEKYYQEIKQIFFSKMH